jgi:quinol monooxygenase YgiN/quercetin dioxygenase-like cupin family protein
MPWKRSAALALATLVRVISSAHAQDPLPRYPENYTVIVENERVRVLDFRLRKGAKEASHSHPAHVVYVVTPFRIRFTFPDGHSAVRVAKAGDVLYSEAVTHASENIGDTDAHGILVELKAGDARSAAQAFQAPQGSADLLTAVTVIRGKPAKEAEIKRELLSLTPPTRREPGNLGYDLYQSADRPGEFLRLEVWRSPEALELHKASPYLRASFERRKDQGWMTEITRWKRVPEEQREQQATRTR